MATTAAWRQSTMAWAHDSVGSLVNPMDNHLETFLGLNMVAACHVILLDLWWNPTTKDQAVDRAHRIRQTRPVTTSHLSIKDIVEDRILALQVGRRGERRKRKGTESWATREATTIWSAAERKREEARGSRRKYREKEENEKGEGGGGERAWERSVALKPSRCSFLFSAALSLFFSPSLSSFPFSPDEAAAMLLSPLTTRPETLLCCRSRVVDLVKQAEAIIEGGPDEGLESYIGAIDQLYGFVVSFVCLLKLGTLDLGEYLSKWHMENLTSLESSPRAASRKSSIDFNEQDTSKDSAYGKPLTPNPPLVLLHKLAHQLVQGGHQEQVVEIIRDTRYASLGTSLRKLGVEKYSKVDVQKMNLNAKKLKASEWMENMPKAVLLDRICQKHAKNIT
ncbi:hypothetical protein Droror1_Dr00025645 [Drosera rotundifolia]